MPDKYDVIVIGLGAMGSATLYQLASRGVRALGIEQFAIPHAKGSYHGYSRMIRMAYYEHKDYVPLRRQAFSLGGLNLASWRLGVQPLPASGWELCAADRPDAR